MPHSPCVITHMVAQLGLLASQLNCYCCDLNSLRTEDIYLQGLFFSCYQFQVATITLDKRGSSRVSGGPALGLEIFE